jgi:hypothetical protein
VADGEDWASESFGGCGDPLPDGDVGDAGGWGDCVEVLSMASNFVGLASLSLSRSLPFTLAEVVFP